MSRKPRNRVWYQCNQLRNESPCCLCDEIMVRNAKRGERGEWHVEHVWALSQGGPDIYPNLIPICKRCNLEMKKNCLSTFHHLADKGYITREEADEQLDIHKLELKHFDVQCTYLYPDGRRCLNHKCGKNERWCYAHVKQDTISKMELYV